MRAMALSDSATQLWHPFSFPPQFTPFSPSSSKPLVDNTHLCNRGRSWSFLLSVTLSRPRHRSLALRPSGRRRAIAVIQPMLITSSRQASPFRSSPSWSSFSCLPTSCGEVAKSIRAQLCPSLWPCAPRRFWSTFEHVFGLPRQHRAYRRVSSRTRLILEPSSLHQSYSRSFYSTCFIQENGFQDLEEIRKN